jgi:chromosome segregation ATPase
VLTFSQFQAESFCSWFCPKGDDYWLCEKICVDDSAAGEKYTELLDSNKDLRKDITKLMRSLEEERSIRDNLNMLLLDYKKEPVKIECTENTSKDIVKQLQEEIKLASANATECQELLLSSRKQIDEDEQTISDCRFDKSEVKDNYTDLKSKLGLIRKTYDKCIGVLCVISVISLCMNIKTVLNSW